MASRDGTREHTHRLQQLSPDLPVAMMTCPLLPSRWHYSECGCYAKQCHREIHQRHFQCLLGFRSHELDEVINHLLQQPIQWANGVQLRACKPHLCVWLRFWPAHGRHNNHMTVRRHLHNYFIIRGHYFTIRFASLILFDAMRALCFRPHT
jgi:hypothetical protein